MPKVTRGNGLLEPFLSKLRAHQANRLIPARLRQGSILDVGCGSSPYFLAHTSFKKKFAIDQLAPPDDSADIEWYVLDINNEPILPYPDAHFNVVTMLAVVEHLNPTSLCTLLGEAHRTLCPGGMLILTTPAAWSDGLLRLMSTVNLVSAEEINEHVYAYTLPLLGWYFGVSGFDMQKVDFGYFELWLNLWATATR